MAPPPIALPTTALGPELDPKRIESAQSQAELAKQFESLLLSELVKAMRATTSGFSDEQDDAFAQGTYQEMFDQAIVDSSAGGLGIGSALTRQLSPPTSSPTRVGLNPLAARRLRSQSPAILSAAERSAPTIAPAKELDGPIGTAFDSATPTPGLWPVDGGVQTSDYGFRIHPIHQERKFHAGIDIAAPQGREIRAVAEGEVVFAGRHPGYGNMVEIRHNDGIVTRYAHASRLHVREGDRIEVGEAIADVGSTGQSTGPHLHFEVRDGSRSVDPQAYLARLRRGSAQDGPKEGRPSAGVRPWDSTLARAVK